MNNIEFDSGDGPYRMVVLRLTGGLSHRCGYVSVPEDHLFFGKGYRYEIPFDVKNAKINTSDPIGTFLSAFKAAEDDSKMSISYAAYVHGGLTYAGGDKGYPLKDVVGSWWFGFDAAHCDDNEDGGKSLEFMISECKKLQTFLKEHKSEAIDA